MNDFLDPLFPIIGDETERAFDAPWQAQAFAIVVELNKAGKFSWGEWVSVFSQEVAESPAVGGETKMDTYYRQWLAALESIVVKRGLISPEETKARAAEWRTAYINTPHGQAVDLAHATYPPPHTHAKISGGEPITVSHASAHSMQVDVM